MKPKKMGKFKQMGVSLILAGSLLMPIQAFAQTDHDSFYWLSEMNKASTVMVVEQEIVTKELGKTIAESVYKVIEDANKDPKLRSGDYLTVEPRLIEYGGPDVSRMHSGRSRQDIGSTSTRLFQREQVLKTLDSLNTTRKALLELAAKYPNAIVPAYTMGVQAQPISFGHYITAYTEALELDAERLRKAFLTANRSPLGAAAVGTSSFPVDRERLGELLGFDSVMENSLYANQISQIDTGVELTSAASSIALTIDTFLVDLEQQYRQASSPWILLGDADTGRSSIMPQKRNPNSIHFARIAASEVVGKATSYMIKAHNVHHGNMDYKGTEPQEALEQAASLLDSIAKLAGELRLDEQRALEEVNMSYSTTTELADMLQRDADVPFRVGHHFASALVTYGRSNGILPSEIPYDEAKRIFTETAKEYEMKNTELPLSEKDFRRSLSPENMVEASKGLGGPQPAEVKRMMLEQQKQLQEDQTWVNQTQAKLDKAADNLNKAFEKIRNGK
jgi:argininosuccinate lyase